jgi:hypothetical protein
MQLPSFRRILTINIGQNEARTGFYRLFAMCWPKRFQALTGQCGLVFRRDFRSSSPNKRLANSRPDGRNGSSCGRDHLRRRSQAPRMCAAAGGGHGFRTRCLKIRSGKGDKDRQTLLPESLKDARCPPTMSVGPNCDYRNSEILERGSGKKGCAWRIP